MKLLTASKQKIGLSIIDFKDKCNAQGQQGVITTAIADEIIEHLSSDQVKNLIYHLNKKIS